MKVDEKTFIMQTFASRLSSSFDKDIKVEKTLAQIFVCQLSLTPMKLSFLFNQTMKVEKNLIQTLVCQLSLTLIQLLFSFDQNMRVKKTLLQTLASQLSSSFDQDLTITTFFVSFDAGQTSKE